MFRRIAIACLLATSPIAVAQESTAVSNGGNPANIGGATPDEPDWYRSFSLSAPDVKDPVFDPGQVRDFGLRWEPGQKFTLNLDVRQHSEDSIRPREEMSAGATLQLSQRFSIGGEVIIAADELDRFDFDERELETGIRLQSAFKF
ncbi:MAG: NtrZ family periplasmic regulatory protein [Pseudomonadota bacterium]